jgi:Transglycosylase SLT domain
MTLYVPQTYVEPLKFMSMNTGIPYAVCACQANEESGFQQYARSSAGALGWLQFEPGTFAEYGGGDIFGIWNQANAYVGYMNHLLRVFHGSIFMALAGYNAGEGNPAAGYGYARVILGCAGQSIGVKGDTTTKVAAQYSEAPAGANSADDWSGHIAHTASRMFVNGHDLFSFGKAIERL